MNRSGGGLERDFSSDVSRGVYSSSLMRVALIGTRMVAAALPGNLATAQDVWPGAAAEYSFASAAEAWEVVSSSAADTVGGAGAETVILMALDSAWNMIDLFSVNLNGTTPVQLPGGARYFRFNGAGIGGITNATGRRRNQGDITIRVSGGGAVRGIIPALVGVTRQAIYTVPAGYTLELFTFGVQILSSSGGGMTRGADFLLTFRGQNGVTMSPLPIGCTDAQPVYINLQTRVRIGEKFDFIPQVVYTSTNNMTVNATWEGHLYKN